MGDQGNCRSLSWMHVMTFFIKCSTTELWLEEKVHIRQLGAVYPNICQLFITLLSSDLSYSLATDSLHVMTYRVSNTERFTLLQVHVSCVSDQTFERITMTVILYHNAMAIYLFRIKILYTIGCKRPSQY